MSHVTFSCPSGHPLRGKPEVVGRKVKCPKCSQVFTASPPPRPELSDTSVMEILGDPSPPPAEEETPEPAHRGCPRCQRQVAVTAHVCPHCQCYVGPLPPEMQRMVGQTPPGNH